MSEILVPESKDKLNLDEPVINDEIASSMKTSEDESEAGAALTDQSGLDASDELRGEPPKAAEEEEPSKAMLHQTAEKKSLRLKDWFQASRPTFFVATLVPLFLGLVASIGTDGEGAGRILLFILILLASFLVHLATNLANDLFDHQQGVDTKETLGGSRVIQEGRITPEQIKKALAICYLAAFALAIIIVRTDRILWGMIIFAAFSSFFYVCPPIRYGHRALGEIFVFLNMGLIMTAGTFYALTKIPDPKLLALALPVALGVANILYFQSLPEIVSDAEKGKKTLAGLLGKERAALVQLLWWPLVWLMMVNLWLAELAAWPALLGVVCLPLHILVMRRIYRAENWEELDKSGILIRLMYLITGVLLISGVCLAKTETSAPPQPVVPAAARPAAVRPSPPEVSPAQSAVAPDPTAQPGQPAQPAPETDSGPEQVAEPAAEPVAEPAAEPDAEPTYDEVETAPEPEPQPNQNEPPSENAAPNGQDNQPPASAAPDAQAAPQPEADQSQPPASQPPAGSSTDIQPDAPQGPEELNVKYPDDEPLPWMTVHDALLNMRSA
ncbi:MAG: UbiA family prenyltransferase [Deltaproteobacteria bacterium]|jgi:1,4-dihydroxy-2-naphthoate octaprenyltransferase|nr:UbiA family prenyltransferase [Deltaproteobacteria bacterium]